MKIFMIIFAYIASIEPWIGISNVSSCYRKNGGGGGGKPRERPCIFTTLCLAFESSQQKKKNAMNQVLISN